MPRSHALGSAPMPESSSPDGKDIRFYGSPDEAWEAMYHDCEQAKKSIEFDQYILQNDAVGQRFLALFADKAKQGVKIHLLLDRVGSRSVWGSRHLKRVTDAGGHVLFYNPLRWINLFMPSTWFPRNHAKTLLIDARTVFIGSVCLHEEMRHWRDIHMRCDLTSLVGDIETDFNQRWQYIIKQKKWHLGRQFMSPPGPFRYVVNHPLRLNPVYKDLLKEIKKAKHYIYIVTPYFLPPFRLQRALKQAVKRGVTVKVMMSEVSDVTLADDVARSYFHRLVKKGIHILLYQGTVLHAKYSVIDDIWATFGSMNMDYLSLWRNREANIILSDPANVLLLRGFFEKDVAKCVEVNRAYCKAISLKHKIIGYAGRIIKRVL